MFERIRRRLTLGYVGIFALILLFIGTVVVASFARQAAGQQDELLEQKARGDADFVAGPLLYRYQEERYSESRGVKADPTAALPVPSSGPGRRTSVWSPWCRAEPKAKKARFWTLPPRLPPSAYPSRGRRQGPPRQESRS